MAWVNGRGYQGACSYRHIAAVAEMLVAFSLYKAWRAIVLIMPALTSRTAGYGPVCPVVWEGHPVRGVPIPIGAPAFSMERRNIDIGHKPIIGSGVVQRFLLRSRKKLVQ